MNTLGPIINSSITQYVLFDFKANAKNAITRGIPISNSSYFYIHWGVNFKVKWVLDGLIIWIQKYLHPISEILGDLNIFFIDGLFFREIITTCY